MSSRDNSESLVNYLEGIDLTAPDFGDLYDELPSGRRRLVSCSSMESL